MLSNRIAQLVPPPRWVPLPVICSAMLGVVGGMGALFFIFGMIGVWVFAGDLHPLDEWRLAHSAATAEATITKVSATNSTENDVRVYEYRFTFRTPDEKTISGRSYSTGRLWTQGDTATVWYLPDKPTVARLDGTRLSTFALWVLFVLIFPLDGMIMFIISTIRGLRHVILLRYGQVSSARTLDRKPTGASVNHQPVMKYTYEFQADTGETRSGSSKAVYTEKIGDEAQEPVLYLPANPGVSMLVDALPLRCPLDVNESGQWAFYGSMWPIVWFGLAWLGIGVSVLLILARGLGVI